MILYGGAEETLRFLIYDTASKSSKLTPYVSSPYLLFILHCAVVACYCLCSIFPEKLLMRGRWFGSYSMEYY